MGEPLLAGQQERLTRMVAFRMDALTCGRIDAVDIVQDAFAEASEHRADYSCARRRCRSFFGSAAWLS